MLRTGQLLVAKEGDLFMQIRRAEGLHDIAYSAVSIALFQLGALSAGGDKDDRDMGQVWLRLNGVCQLIAITDRHRNIGKNEIWTHALDELQSFGTIGGDIDLMFRRAQHHAQKFLNHYFIFAKDNLSHNIPQERESVKRTVKWKIEPLPTTLSAQIWPPCN